MTAFFVTRHPGALAWAESQGIRAQTVAHLSADEVGPGDLVMGNLPIQLACAIIERGARYLHLELDVPAEARGRDLSAEDMKSFNARLTEFHIVRVKE